MCRSRHGTVFPRSGRKIREIKSTDRIARYRSAPGNETSPDRWLFRERQGGSFQIRIGTEKIEFHPGSVAFDLLSPTRPSLGHRSAVRLRLFSFAVSKSKYFIQPSVWHSITAFESAWSRTPILVKRRFPTCGMRISRGNGTDNGGKM